MKLNKLILSIFFILFISCNESYISKPRGYFKIDIPEPFYKNIDIKGFPYNFEYDTMATIVQKTDFFGVKADNPFWINLEYKKYNAGIFISYKDVNGYSNLKSKLPDGSYKDSLGKNNYETLVSDAFNLTQKNIVKATDIEELPFKNEQGVTGLLFNVKGDAATNLQFFVTDTTKHFLRGALYFATQPNSDSLAPVLDLMKKDINQLIKTFKWNK